MLSEVLGFVFKCRKGFSPVSPFHSTTGKRRITAKGALFRIWLVCVCSWVLMRGRYVIREGLDGSNTHGSAQRFRVFIACVRLHKIAVFRPVANQWRRSR